MRHAATFPKPRLIHPVVCVCLTALLTAGLAPQSAQADGKLVRPKLYQGVPYQGSLEEQAQEAIIIFQGSDQPAGAREDLILKVRVAGEVDHFAWVVPFPQKPEVHEESEQLFKEIYDYVDARLMQLSRAQSRANKSDRATLGAAEARPVEVLSRKIVGSFDVAVVQENEAGALNGWLDREGYQPLEDADDVLSFYRDKQYVFACIKVSDAELAKDTPVDLHPLRFSFKTGGRDGIYFPMKMTGLQQDRFDVNLYVFYRAWLNDHLSKFGYEHRGFTRKYRDWDSPQCKPNAGKAYSNPARDPLLRSQAGHLVETTKLMRKLHPGERYYLTNIQARGLDPKDVRVWTDDLWLFPYYIDRDFVPFDARLGGPAATAWPNEVGKASDPVSRSTMAGSTFKGLTLISVAGITVLLFAGMVLAVALLRSRSKRAA